jgi:tetratricopeptide (TPR) repeat protein
LSSLLPEKISNSYCRPEFALFAFLAIFAVASCGSPEKEKMKLYGKGQALYADSEYEKAGKEFENALQVDPKFADALYMLGMTHLMRGDTEEAYFYLNMAEKADPTNLKTQIQLGELLLISGHPDRAMEKAERILAEDPGNYEAQLLEAKIRLFDKEAPKAARLLEEMIGKGARRPEPFLLLAKAYLDDGNMKSAKESLMRGIDASDNAILLHQMLSDI